MRPVHAAWLALFPVCLVGLALVWQQQPRRRPRKDAQTAQQHAVLLQQLAHAITNSSLFHQLRISLVDGDHLLVEVKQRRASRNEPSDGDPAASSSVPHSAAANIQPGSSLSSQPAATPSAAPSHPPAAALPPHQQHPPHHSHLSRLSASSNAESPPPAPLPQPPSAPTAAAAPAAPAPAVASAASGDPGVVPMSATRVVMHQIVLPSEVDTLGICFGGQVLSWIDVCAGMSAKSLARCPCVTASVDSVHFLRPCRVGTVVIVAAMVNRTFKSSMEVGVRVESEDMRTGVRHHCCTAFLTFVALGDRTPRRASSEHPTSTSPPPPSASSSGSSGSATGSVPLKPHGAVLPRVVPTNEEQRVLFTQAEERRSRRLQQRARVQGDPKLAAALDLCRLRPITHMDACFTLPPSIEADPEDAPSTTSNNILSPQNSDRTAAVRPGAAAAAAPHGAGLAADPAGSRNGSMLRSRKPVRPHLTTAYMTQCIMPQHANTQAITFGGVIMAWVEQCAYISASRMRGSHILTASMDSVTFVKSTRVGDILYLTSQVTAIFGSSMEVMVSINAEDPNVGKLFHCADAYVTVVTVSDISSLPPLLPSQASAPSLAADGLGRAPSPAEGGPAATAAGGIETPASPLPHSSSSVSVAAALGASSFRAKGQLLAPVCLPFELLPETPTEVLRYEGALARREERLRDRQALSQGLPSVVDRYKPSLVEDRVGSARAPPPRVSSMGSLLPTASS